MEFSWYHAHILFPQILICSNEGGMVYTRITDGETNLNPTLKVTVNDFSKIQIPLQDLTTNDVSSGMSDEQICEAVFLFDIYV